MVRFLIALLVGLVMPVAASASSAAEKPVVFVGMTGVEWEDISDATPTLQRLTRDAAIGHNVTRSVRSWTCPADGWLALSAGRRAADPLDDDGRCVPMAGSPTERWDVYTEAAASESYSAVLGTFGDYLREHGVPSAGVGEGAAIALAGTSGEPVGPVELVPHVRDTPSIPADDEPADPDAETPALPAIAPVDPERIGPAVENALANDPGLLVIDLGGAPRGEHRESDLQAIDAALAEVMERVEGAEVLVASVSDAGRSPRLQLAALLDGEGDADPALLGSPSTRQKGLLQTTDLAPTILNLLDLAPLPGLPGSPAQAASISADPLETLLDDAAHAYAVRPVVPAFFALLVVLNVVLYLAVALLISGRVRARFPALGAKADRIITKSPRALRILEVTATFMAALPVASFLANLVPWWRTGAPGLTLWALVLGGAALVTALALVPWRRYLLTPIAVVGILTWLALTAEAFLGGPMQFSGLMGYQSLVAGRFYGFGNAAFTIFSTAALLVALLVAHTLRNRPLLAALGVAAIGGATAVLDGHPGLGADFGGPPAILPAFGVFILLVLGVRLTVKRVLLVGGVSAVAALSFAVVDWLRPPESRTHLGNFVQTVLDGGLFDVIVRKLQQNLMIIFASTLTLVAVAGIVLLLVAFLPRKHPGAHRDDVSEARSAAFHSLLERVPSLRPTLIALVVLWGIGFAINDSGVLIVSVGMALAVPLLVGLAARATTRS